MLQRTYRFKVIFDEELKHGHTFDISLEDFRRLTHGQIATKVFKEIIKAGVTIELNQFIEEVEDD